MAPKEQSSYPPLVEALLHAAGRFDFFQAVRVVRRASNALPVGYDQLPEVARFKSVPSLGFPATSVVAVRRCSESKGTRAELEMLVSFMGLAGPAGVLPAHYTRLLIDRVRQKDFALRDFLDLFNHRLISLFFRAWEKCHFPPAYEQSCLRHEKEDLFTACLYSLLGFGTGYLRTGAGGEKRLDFDTEALLFYGGLFCDQHRPAVGLEQVLVDYFDVPVHLEELRGRWLDLDEPDRSAFPDSSCPQGRNLQLGIDFIVGDRVWDIQSGFRIRVGPVTFADFRRWIPPGDALKPLCQLVRTYVGLGLEFDVQVILKGSEIPRCQLGNEDNQALLGYTTWLLYGPAEPDRTDSWDPVFTLDGI
jgi:type VI secretion system protein ImpH